VQGFSQASHQTLEVLDQVMVPRDGWQDDLVVNPYLGLTQFAVLRELTLWDTLPPADPPRPPSARLLPRLPTSLTSLTFSIPTYWQSFKAVVTCAETHLCSPTCRPSPGHRAGIDPAYISSIAPAELPTAPWVMCVPELHVGAQHLSRHPLMAHSTASCRHPDPFPEWSVAHVTRLTVLSLCGQAAREAMSTLLRSRAAPVLPASLLELRFQSPTAVHFTAEDRCSVHEPPHGNPGHRGRCCADGFHTRFLLPHGPHRIFRALLIAAEGPAASCSCRAEPLAEVNIPLLAVQTDAIDLEFRSKYYMKVDTDDKSEAADFGLRVVSADLPIGFRVLGLRTARIRVTNAVHLTSKEPAGIDVAQELCYFLSLAPRCYRQFRLFDCLDHPAHYVIDATREWRPRPMGPPLQCVAHSFDTLPAVAAAMQRYADAHRLAVSVSLDQTHLLVVRC